MRLSNIYRLVAWLFVCSLASASCTCERSQPTTSDSTTSRTADGSDTEASPAAAQDDQVQTIEVPGVPGPEAATIVFTGGIRGFTEPCGCSEASQLGGIDRLAHVVAEWTSANSSVVLDAGDLFFQALEIPDATRSQEIARAEVIADAVRHMDTRWTVPGSYDLVDGVETYRRLVERANIRVISTNGTETLRKRVDAVTHARVSIGGWDLLVVGLTAPSSVSARYADDFRGVDVSLAELRSGLGERTWDAAIVLFQGTAQTAQTLLRASNSFSFDFVVIGKNTQAGAQVLNIADTHGLEVFDQAREVGALRLIGEPGRVSSPRWTAIQREGHERRAAINEQLERAEAQVVVLRERLDGRESALLTRLEMRVRGYQRELDELNEAEPGTAAAPADRNSFAWHTLEVAPQFRRDRAVEALRVAFNESLRALNLANAPPPPPAAEGAPRFIGTDTCKGCHQAAHAFWETTAHGSAIDTLIERSKRYDTSCVGCHVTGFEMPGGSSLGHLDGLENVQCESCHGPGSAHAAAPVDVAADINVSLHVEASTCQQCHTPEHSPEFDYDNYHQLILGPGHGAPSVE